MKQSTLQWYTLPSFQSAQQSYWQLPKDDSGSHRVKIADFMHSGNTASNRNTENNFPCVNQPYTVNECGAYYQPVQGHTFIFQAIFTSMQEASEMSAQKSTSVWKSTSMQTSSWGSLKIKIAYCIYRTVNKVTQTPIDEGSVYSTQHCTMTPAATCTSTTSSKTVFWNTVSVIRLQSTSQVKWTRTFSYGDHTTPSLGGTWMAVRRKNISSNKPNENLWAVFLCEKPITRISCLGKQCGSTWCLGYRSLHPARRNATQFSFECEAFFSVNFP
jgi:hypothetical protein